MRHERGYLRMAKNNPGRRLQDAPARVCGPKRSIRRWAIEGCMGAATSQLK